LRAWCKIRRTALDQQEVDVLQRGKLVQFDSQLDADRDRQSIRIEHPINIHLPASDQWPNPVQYVTSKQCPDGSESPEDILVDDPADPVGGGPEHHPVAVLSSVRSRSRLSSGGALQFAEQRDTPTLCHKPTGDFLSARESGCL